MIAKNPTTPIITVLTLALGMGATTAMFSVMEAVLLRPLPFHDANPLIAVWGEAVKNRTAPPFPHLHGFRQLPEPLENA